MYASPSRDARLKAAFRELYETVAAVPPDSQLRPALRAIWTQQAESSDCHFVYRNSLRQPVELNLAEVLERLFF